MSEDATKLTIHLDLDRSQARASNGQFKQEAKQVEAEILTDVQAAERAKIELVRQTNREKVNAALGGLKAAKTAAGEELAALRTVAAAEKAKAAAARQAAAEGAQAHAGAASSLENLGKAVGSFGLQMLGLDSAKAVLGTIVGHFEQARDSAYKASKMVNDYRQSLLELAALKGHLGDTTAEVKEQVLFRAKTLQTAGDAKRFQEAALGVGESAIDKPGVPKLIAPDEFKKAMEHGGAFQAAEGGDAATHATLIGLLPQLLGRRTTGDEVARKEAQLYKIFQPGGASFTSLSNQYAKSLAPLIGSKTYDPMRGAALLSAFSTSNKEGAGEEVQQFTRATLGGVDKTGKPRVLGGTPIGAYYSALGIDEKLLKSTKSTDLPFVIADKVSADLAVEEKAAQAKGEEFNRLIYLKHKGFANQEDTNAVLHYSALKESGLLDKTFMPLAADAALPTLDAARAPVLKAQAADPALQAQKAALAEELSTIAVGAGKTEYADSLRRIAFARRKAGVGFGGEADRETMNSYDEVKQLGGLSPTELIYGPQQKTGDEAWRLLKEEARRVGVAPEKINEALFNKEGNFRPIEDQLYELGSRVAERGGNVLPGFDPVAGAAGKSLDESARFSALGASAAGANEAVAVLKDVRTELQKQNQATEAPAAAPPPPMRAAPAVPFR